MSRNKVKVSAHTRLVGRNLVAVDAHFRRAYVAKNKKKDDKEKYHEDEQ